MGIQTNIILGGLLIASLGASALYINLQKSKIEKLQVELNVAIQNQKVLENTVAEQNENMKQQLENQKQNQEKIRELTETSNKANEEVKKLRNTFARHDLNNLAIAKPGLMEGIVNRGTKKVNSELIELTNPGQFDEEVIIN
jgi:CRISPR/Cas system-associated protein Csx1|tara:strand:+ start:47 stop:472 length:426 start_codon:yes stop_codon:yes gene_type:complete